MARVPKAFPAIQVCRWLDAWPVQFRRPRSRWFEFTIVPLGVAATFHLCWGEPRHTAEWWARKALAHEEHGTGWPSTIGHHHHILALVRQSVRSVTVIASDRTVWDGNHRLIAAIIQRRQGKHAPSHVGLLREVNRKG